MTNLIKGDDQRMTSREVAEFTGKRHSDVMRDIRKQEHAYIEVFGTERKFALSDFNDPTGRTLQEFLLTKSQALFIASSYDAVTRARIQKRWEELESSFKSQQPKNLSKMEILQLAIESEKRVLELEIENKELAPKAEVADQFLSSGDYTSMNATAKMIGIGRNTMMKILREKKVLISAQGVDRNTPYQKHMKHFKVIVDEITVDDRVHVSKATYVRPSGIDFIRNTVSKKS